jgi:hypothetical protein
MSAAMILRKPLKLAAVVLGCVLLLLPNAVEAQEMRRAAAEFSAGWMGFPDDGEVVSEALIGGAVRWHLTPRVSVGPELLWIAGAHHSHLVVTGNMTFDMFSPMNGRPAPITPFIVVGGGLFRTNESFLNGDFSSTEGGFTVGGGVRGNPSDRITLGIDARLGWETHIRVNGFVGVRF